MYAWRAIQNVLDYIEGNLSGFKKLRPCPCSCIISILFSTMFGRLVKKPVNEYVKLRRLEKAAEELKDEARRILDIAFGLRFFRIMPISACVSRTHMVLRRRIPSSPLLCSIIS